MMSKKGLLKFIKYTLIFSNAFGFILAIFLGLFGIAYPDKHFPLSYKGREMALCSLFCMLFTSIGYCGAHNHKRILLIIYGCANIIIVLIVVIMWVLFREDSILGNQEISNTFITSLAITIAVMFLFSFILAFHMAPLKGVSQSQQLLQQNAYLGPYQAPQPPVQAPIVLQQTPAQLHHSSRTNATTNAVHTSLIEQQPSPILTQQQQQPFQLRGASGGVQRMTSVGTPITAVGALQQQQQQQQKLAQSIGDTIVAAQQSSGPSLVPPPPSATSAFCSLSAHHQVAGPPVVAPPPAPRSYQQSHPQQQQQHHHHHHHHQQQQSQQVQSQQPPPPTPQQQSQSQVQQETSQRHSPRQASHHHHHQHQPQQPASLMSSMNPTCSVQYCTYQCDRTV